MKKLSEEDIKQGWVTVEEKEWFDKFYISDCSKCHSTSCVVRGGWRNPCFYNTDEYKKTQNKK